LVSDAVIAVAGRRYVDDDFRIRWVNGLSKFASGVQGEFVLTCLATTLHLIIIIRRLGLAEINMHSCTPNLKSLA